MIFEIGKLYKCTSHYLLIYPTKETAAAVAAAKVLVALAAARTSWWSEELNCKVNYSIPNEPFMVLKSPEKDKYQYINVLFGDKMGWIIYNEKWNDWLKIERIV